MRPGILAGSQVLVVDDEPDNGEFLIVALKQCGATATEDGYWPIRKARSSECDTIKRLPAVALTAYASEEDRDRAIAADYDEHLTKPIDPALFAAVLGNLTNLH